MPLYRGRIYSVEELQKLTFTKRYLDELKLYKIHTFDESNFRREYIEDNLVNTANVTLLYAIDRYINHFIEEREFNFICDSIITYMANRDLLGDIKVHGKIMKLLRQMHYKPFVATT